MRRLAAYFLVVLMAGRVGAAIETAPIFNDHMVVQRGAPLVVWGTAGANAAMTLSFRGAQAQTKADAKGHFEISLPAGEAGGPFVLTVEGDGRKEIKDVMVGDVWLCSGQSNMALPVTATLNAEAEIAAAKDGGIRLFEVTKTWPVQPEERFDGNWAVTSPTTAGEFPGTVYYFAREYRKIHPDVPLGLIHASWGGTAIEAWLPRDLQEKDAEMRAVTAVLDELQARYPEEKKIYDEKNLAWKKEAQAAKEAGRKEPVAPVRPKGRPQAGVGVLYNGMIYPLRRYPIRGVLWYQGENNIEAAALYARQFPLLIQHWRELWKQPDMPFFFVQLAGVGRPGPGKVDGWAWLREAQSRGLDLPHTGMALALDIGDKGLNTHPHNKQEVGRRLSLLVREKADGEAVTSEGPFFKKCDFEKGVARVEFEGGGLKVREGGDLTGFVVAGDDKKFRMAQAKIEGRSVLVSSPEVPEPVAVRYAWSNLGEGGLVNEEGLPAAPFRTDRWDFSEEAVAMSLLPALKPAKPGDEASAAAP